MANPTSAQTIGIDVGGGTIRAVAFDHDGKIVASDRRETPSDPTQLAPDIADAICHVTNGNQHDPNLVVGIGIPGQVDEQTGIIRHAVNLEISTTGYPLQAKLAALGISRVHLENDVNAAALGIASSSASPLTSLALLNIGTGIAAGIILNGEILRGHQRLAGEIGHIPVDPGGAQCVCGQIGCLETLASGTAIANSLPAPLNSASNLAEARSNGDAIAMATWDRLAHGIAWATQLLCFTVDVETVLLTGGVSRLGDPLLESVKKRLNTQARNSAVLAAADLKNRISIAEADNHVAPAGARLAALNAGV